MRFALKAKGNRPTESRLATAARAVVEKMEARQLLTASTIAAWNFNNLTSGTFYTAPPFSTNNSTGTPTASSIGMSAGPTVYLGAATAGTFTLTITDGSTGSPFTTGALTYSATAATMASTIQSALQGLHPSTTGAITAAPTVNATGANTNAFNVNLASDPTAVITGSGTGLTGGTKFNVQSVAPFPTTGADGPDLSVADLTSAEPGSSDGNTGLDWKVVGANGYNNAAGIGTQGAQFLVPTTNYAGITMQFDWDLASAKAVGQLAVEYTLDATVANPTWLPAPSISATGDALTAVETNTTATNSNIINGSYFQEINQNAGAWQNALTADFSSVAGAANDAKFGIRLVNAATGVAVVGSAAPVTPTAVSESGATVTVTAAEPTGGQAYNVGDSVTIAGFTGAAAGYNGNFLVGSVSGTTGTVNITYTAAAGLPAVSTFTGVTVIGGPSQSSSNWRFDEVIVSGNPTVFTAPVVTTSPVSQTVNGQTSVSFTAAATGNPAPQVQWYYATPSAPTTFLSIANDPTDFPGVTSNANTLTFTATPALSGYLFEAQYTNAYNGGTTVASGTATLTVPSNPVITLQPTDEFVNLGQPATFTASALGGVTPTVQWFYATASAPTTFLSIANDPTDFPGVVSNAYTLTFTPKLALTGYKFEAVFTSTGFPPAATTNIVSLVLLGAPITQWTFPSAAPPNTSSNYPNSVPANVGVGTAIPLGMTNDYNGVQSVPADDIVGSAAVLYNPGGKAFSENTWRVRGGSGQGSQGSPGTPEGWSSLAPQEQTATYTYGSTTISGDPQGAEFPINTTGYNSVAVHLDWYSTGSGVRDLQPQYTTNTTAGTPVWTNVGPVLIANSAGYYGDSTTGITGINLNFQGSTYSAVANDPNFAVRFVAAYDPALPSINDANPLAPGSHGQYATASAAVQFLNQQIVVPPSLTPNSNLQIRPAPNGVGGTFTLTIPGVGTTAPITIDTGYTVNQSSFDTSNLATDIANAINTKMGLPLTGPTSVTVATMDDVASNFTVTFPTAPAGQMTATSSLTGTSATVAVTYSGTVIPYTIAGTGNWRFGNISAYGDTQNGAPETQIQPANQTATLTDGVHPGLPTVTFNASAYSEATPQSTVTVQWQVNENPTASGGGTWLNISNGVDAPTGITYSGATAITDPTTGFTYTAALTVTATNINQTGFEYRAQFAASGVSAPTNAATLTVVILQPPSITVSPTSITTTTAAPNNTAAFTASATGLPASTVIWKFSTDGTTWNVVPNTLAGYGVTTSSSAQANGYQLTTSTLTFTTIIGETTYQYEAFFSNQTSNSVATAPATLTVLAAESAIAQWTFPNVTYDNSPAPQVTLAPSVLSSLGFNDANFQTEYGGQPSVTADDVTSTTASADTNFTENTWRVRGGPSATVGGAPSNGWDYLAPQYSQGIEADVNTTGYSQIYVTFDWYTTAQGVRDLQEQYNTNVNNPAGWTNVSNGLLTATPSGDYYGVQAAAAPTGAVINLTGISGASNNANFGIRLVAAYDAGLPAVQDTLTVSQNNTYIQNPTQTDNGAGALVNYPESISNGAVVGTRGQYASATLVNGQPSALNGSSGNWRFGPITVAGVASVTPPTLSSSQVGAGATQRSTFNSIKIVFNEAVNFSTTSFTLSHETVADNQAVQNGGGTVNPTYTNLVNANDVTFSSSDGGTTWILSPKLGGAVDRTAGAGDINGLGIFADGLYKLTLHGAQITDLASGTANFNSGSDQLVQFADGNGTLHNEFSSLFGDAAGTGIVSNADNRAFSKSYLTTFGQTNYNAAFDYFGTEATISNGDNRKFAANYLVSLLFN